MNFKTRSRILNGVRLFLVLGVGTLVTNSKASGTEELTIEGRINRNAYFLERQRDKFTPIPDELEKELRGRIAQVLSPIRLAPASWFKTVFGTEFSPGNRRKILASIAETEIWGCLGESCPGCSGDESSGCILGKSISGGVGVVAVIHPCLYGRGACERGASRDLNLWVEHFVLGVAYYKAGFQKNTIALRKAQKVSQEWLLSTSRSVNTMLGACPGPYSADSLRFLFKLGSVSLPNPALLRCGQEYYDTLRGLPKRCVKLSKTYKKEWDAFYKKQLRASADILRCDSYCLKLLCRKKNAGTLLTLFSDKPALLLGDGACEGKEPKLLDEFLRDSLPPDLRSKLENDTCLPGRSKKDSSDGEGMGGLEDGPSVQLIE
jgi:hypothetical protein